MAAYVPSGKVGGAGIGLTLGLGLVTGAIAAVLFHYVGRFFYLVILFPIAWGLAIGAAVAVGVRMGKCRNSVVGLAAGIVAAVASFGVFQFLENRHVRSTFKEYMTSQVAAVAGSADFDEAYDNMLVKQHGGSGFMAQIAVRADMGMNISRRGRGGDDKKPMIHGMGMYVYWFVEMAIIAGACGLLALGATRAAFCEKCEEWYESSELAGIVSGRVEEARKAIVAKDYGRLQPLVVRTNPGGALSVEKCPKCTASPVVVKVESVTVDNKGKEQRATVFEEMIPAADAQALETALTQGPAAT